MKTVCVTMLLGLLLFAGCDTTLDGTTINNSVAQAEKLQLMTDQLQDLVGVMAKAYNDANLLSSADYDKVKVIQTQTDKVQAEFAKILASIKTGNYDPNNTSFENALELAITATQATSPFNKYAPVIIVTLSLIGMIFKWFKKSKALNEVVMGNETFKKLTADMPLVLAKFKEAQTLQQSESTSKEVKAITA